MTTDQPPKLNDLLRLAEAPTPDPFCSEELTSDCEGVRSERMYASDSHCSTVRHRQCNRTRTIMPGNGFASRH